jgi:hypothetical protein
MQPSQTIGARRLFGKPYAKNGVVVIPVAKIRAGTRGAGPGPDKAGGMSGRPVGAYVINGERVKWKPAIDVNGLMFRGQAFAALAVLIALIRWRR